MFLCETLLLDRQSFSDSKVSISKASLHLMVKHKNVFVEFVPAGKSMLLVKKN